jgi:hypothetical protein
MRGWIHPSLFHVGLRHANGAGGNVEIVDMRQTTMRHQLSLTQVFVRPSIGRLLSLDFHATSLELPGIGGWKWPRHQYINSVQTEPIAGSNTTTYRTN